MSDPKDRTHGEIQFNTQIGTKATVQRTTVSREKASAPNQALAHLGLACHPSPQSQTKYMGSAAVHIYWHEGLEQVFFISQADGLKLYACPEILAIKASEDLIQSIKQAYGHKRQTRRSGF